MGDTFIWVIIPIILSMWVLIAVFWYKGMAAEYMDDMAPYAAVACFGAFLFTGPFCFVVWISFMYRAIWLSGRYKFENPHSGKE